LLLGFGTLVVSLIAVIGLSRAQSLELHGSYSAQSAMSTGFFYQGQLKKGAAETRAVGRLAHFKQVFVSDFIVD